MKNKLLIIYLLFSYISQAMDTNTESAAYFQLYIPSKYKNHHPPQYAWNKISRPKKITKSDKTFTMIYNEGESFRFFNHGFSATTERGESNNPASLINKFQKIIGQKDKQTHYIVFLDEDKKVISVMARAHLRIWQQNNRCAMNATSFFEHLTLMFLDKCRLEEECSLLNSAVNQEILSAQDSISIIENEIEEIISQKNRKLDTCYMREQKSAITEEGLNFLIKKQVDEINPIIQNTHKNIATLKQIFFKHMLIGSSFLTIFMSALLYYWYSSAL